MTGEVSILWSSGDADGTADTDNVLQHRSSIVRDPAFMTASDLSPCGRAVRAGYKELYEIGVNYRQGYPHFYALRPLDDSV